MQPSPGATQAHSSPGLSPAEHEAIRAISAPVATIGPWQRIEWSRHAPTTLVVPDAEAAVGLRVVAEFERVDEAQLAEAAPDLLAALQALLERSGMDFWPREQDAARAAIAKAKGVSHG